MPLNIKLTASTLKALAKFVQVLDKYRFGAVMFILVIISTGAALALANTRLPLA